MTRAKVHLSLVVPVFNGADQLPDTLRSLRDHLCVRPYPAELVLVDDGSAPAVREILDRFCEVTPGARLLRNDRNRGKGFAIARGMLAAHGDYRVFTDADLAYPLEEVNTVLGGLEAGEDVAIACRVLPESRYTMSPAFFSYLYTRHLMSRAFNLVVRASLLPGTLDTQAGLKGFTARAAELVFPRLTIPGFAFDVECLAIARRHGLRVGQHAVCYRYDSEPTTVRFVKDAVEMLAALASISWKGWRGRYD